MAFGIATVVLALVWSVAFGSSSYESVQKLNEYGHAIQLSHASKASSLGRSIIVVQRPHCHWIVSLKEGLSYRRQDIRLAHWLYSPTLGCDDFHYQAVVGSGVQPDLLWIVRQLRRACVSNWDRYDSFGSTPMLLHCATELLQRFWKYNENNRYRHVVLSSLDDMSWSRPFGVRVALLSRTETCGCQLHVIEPSGMVTNCSRWVCLGQQAAQLDEAMTRFWQENGNEEDDEIRQRLAKTVSEVLNCPLEKVQIQITEEAASLAERVEK